MTKPILVAVAPNGARRGRDDHPAIPLSAVEIAADARACLKAGAAMLHLHVRDAAGRHSLDARLYEESVERVVAATSGKMLVQVTSEAAGVYIAEQQIEALEALRPAFVSLALREIMPTELNIVAARDRMRRLSTLAMSQQFILYDHHDVERFEELCDVGIFEDRPQVLLFVMGKYSGVDARPEMVESFLTAMRRPHRWMACAFGRHEHEVLRLAASLGGHVRVGFENNFYRLGGRIANMNSELVQELCEALIRDGHTLANLTDARAIMTDR